MEFIADNLAQYVAKNTTGEPALLAELNRETWQKVPIPRMLAGDFQGRVLSMLSHMIKPKCVLELGTYTGYSALCFAEGLTNNGVVHTIEIDEEREPMIRKYFELSEYKGQIELHIGSGLDILPNLDCQPDLVYLDADKENYANYYNLLIDKVPSGGFIIADNVLWSGNVLKNESEMDADTKALNAYNQMVLEDERVENVLLPIRDGLNVARKL